MLSFTGGLKVFVALQPSDLRMSFNADTIPNLSAAMVWMLGHNSKAIHRAYAKSAKLKVPSLESLELLR